MPIVTRFPSKLIFSPTTHMTSRFHPQFPFHESWMGTFLSTSPLFALLLLLVLTSVFFYFLFLHDRGPLIPLIALYISIRCLHQSCFSSNTCRHCWQWTLFAFSILFFWTLWLLNLCFLHNGWQPSFGKPTFDTPDAILSVSHVVVKLQSITYLPPQSFFQFQPQLFLIPSTSPLCFLVRFLMINTLIHNFFQPTSHSLLGLLSCSLHLCSSLFCFFDLGFVDPSFPFLLPCRLIFHHVFGGLLK